jgi:hypothetical protein
MKNLPSKIYLNLNMTPQEVIETKDKDFHQATKTWEITWSEECLSEYDPEYVHKDFFIEKACEWIKEHKEVVETEDNGIIGCIPDYFIEDFKKYMYESK